LISEAREYLLPLDEGHRRNGGVMETTGALKTLHFKRDSSRARAARAACLALALVIAIHAGRALAAHVPGQVERPSHSAVRIANPPRLDGIITGDSAWASVPATGEFVQTKPDEGQPASQRTDVRFAYTADTLYIGIVCFDQDPGAIVVSDSRRDADLTESDSVMLVLDTYMDGQNGFVFGTNPSGLQYDGQLTREGTGGSGMGRGNDGFNRNWDGVWTVETHIGEYGWSAEFALPFKTLRYPDTGKQSWGLNVQRNIRRRNENAFWAPLARQYDLYRVSDAGHLHELLPPAQRNLKFIPYLRTAFTDVGQAGAGSDTETGFDVKYSVTPSLTLDLTYNTDFAQVEVDEAQINLDRFNLFFPEKRPFFLENAGLFAVGRPGSVELFFSRRIGISDDGEVVPIDGGVRLSGKVDRTNVGLLYMRTDSLDGRVAANDFTVARVSQDIGRRSSLGAMYVGREAAGALAAPGDDNRTFGIDGRWGIGERTLINGFVARTSSPGPEGDDLAWSVEGDYDSEAWSFGLGFSEVQENFNPEVGFLQRSAHRYFSTSLLYRYRPPDSRRGLHEVRPHYSYRAYHDLDGFKESATLHLDNHWEFKSGAEIHTGINFTHEGLLEPFEIDDGSWVPAGSYANSELQLYGYTDQGAPFSAELWIVAGGFFNGDRVQLEPGMRWRHGERFTSSWSWVRNDVKLPTGNFTTDLGRVRLSYTLSDRSTLQALFQYNSVDENWSANLRYSWLRTANTGLFIVYNDTQGFGGYTGAQPNRSLLIKYSHLFDVF
jgi:hypothetical protein